MKKILMILLLVSCSFSAKSDYVQLQDMPLQEVARLTSEKTEFSLILPSGLSGSISFFKGLDLSPVDFKDFLLGAIRVSGFDYEIKGKQIFLKSDPEQIIFKDYFSRSYRTEKPDINLSAFLDENGRSVVFENYHLIYASPEQHRAIANFLSSIKSDEKKFISSVLFFEDADFSKIKAFKFSDELQIVTDEKTRKVVLYGPSEEVSKARTVLRHFDRPQKTFKVSLLIASLNKKEVTQKGFGFAFAQGGFSIDVLKSAFAFNSLSNSVQAISAFAEYLQSDLDSSIVSQPFLQVRDGSTALLDLGKEVPFLESTIDQATGQSIQNVVRKNVGLSLSLSLTEISPEKISLHIKQQLSNISNTQLQNETDIITDQQSIETEIHVTPGRIYSFGGLTDQRRSDATSTGILSFGDTSENESREIVAFVYVDAVETPKNEAFSFWWD